MTDHSPEPNGILLDIQPPYLPLYRACSPPAQSQGVEKQGLDNPSTTAIDLRMIVALYSATDYKVSEMRTHEVISYTRIAPAAPPNPSARSPKPKVTHGNKT